MTWDDHESANDSWSGGAENHTEGPEGSWFPGNHGHPASAPIPFFVSGGSPCVVAGWISSEPARTIDVAPTVGALFGLTAPEGGYDGTARMSAFTASRSRRH